ncbi:hypothetical protein AALP_AA6G339700 [Arabis alpina]|uniref:PGG domain-containing protein n=1 Tax=Arabis alpina TaxID=50452 RepID=A0A087GTH0_ARAAL|nr:hypothetical protein AALP_AA6G339700 [Arabis alpina]
MILLFLCLILSVGQSTLPTHDPTGSSSLNPALLSTPPAHHETACQSAQPAHDATGLSALNPTLQLTPLAYHETDSSSQNILDLPPPSHHATAGQSPPHAHDATRSYSLNLTLQSTPPTHQGTAGQSTPPTHHATGSSSVNPTLQSTPPAHHGTGSSSMNSTLQSIPRAEIGQSSSSSTPLRAIPTPWYINNPFMAVEPVSYLHRPQAPFHNMDILSSSVLAYFFTGSLGFTAGWVQRPTLSTSIYVQSFLNQVAFSLFLLAHTVFARRNPAWAFVLDRIAFFLMVVSAYLATMPMFSPYIAIIMLLIVAIVNIYAHRRA